MKTFSPQPVNKNISFLSEEIFGFKLEEEEWLNLGDFSGQSATRSKATVNSEFGFNRFIKLYRIILLFFIRYILMAQR